VAIVTESAKPFEFWPSKLHNMKMTDRMTGHGIAQQKRE